MVDFGDVGVICVNQDIEGVCQNCLWWEWDSRLQLCGNCQSPLCAIYRQQLFSVGSEPRPRKEPLAKSPGPRPSNGDSADPPAAKVGEAGNV